MNQEEINKNTEAEKQPSALSKKNDEFLQKGVAEVGGAIVGALVGLALGGPIGAILGATTPPVLSITYNIFNRALERRRERAQQVVERAFLIAQMTPEEGITLLNSDDNKADDFLNLLRMVTESDPSFDKVLGAILGETLIAKSNQQRERLLILGDAIRNIRSIHLHILKSLYDAGGTLKASGIALAVGIPEIELRSVVRDLELRGMIKDSGVHPIEWKLRELGNAVIHFTTRKEGE